MKTVLIILLAVLTALMVYQRLSSDGIEVEPLPSPVEVTVLEPLEEITAPIIPIVQTVEPQHVEVPVAVPEPKRPVQTLEERGDSMLFEASALGATPFDQSVTMPFDSP